jgi:DNA-binding transcriptional MerR regulator
MPTELLTASDVARLIDRTPDAVRRATDRGLLRPVASTVGGIRLYDRAAVAEYLSRRYAADAARGRR